MHKWTSYFMGLSVSEEPSAAGLIMHSWFVLPWGEQKRFEPTAAGQSHASCPYSADWESKDEGFLTRLTQRPQSPHRKNENWISHQDLSRALSSLHITEFNAGIWFNVQNEYSRICRHQWTRPRFPLLLRGSLCNSETCSEKKRDKNIVWRANYNYFIIIVVFNNVTSYFTFNSLFVNAFCLFDVLYCILDVLLQSWLNSIQSLLLSQPVS